MTPPHDLPPTFLAEFEHFAFTLLSEFEHLDKANLIVDLSLQLIFYQTKLAVYLKYMEISKTLVMYVSYFGPVTCCALHAAVNNETKAGPLCCC